MKTITYTITDEKAVARGLDATVSRSSDTVKAAAGATSGADVMHTLRNMRRHLNGGRDTLSASEWWATNEKAGAAVEAVAAMIEREAALTTERDALAAEVKELREDAGRWHEIAARYDAASGLQCANVLAAFGYPHDQPWYPLGHFVDAARASAATEGTK